MVPWEKPSLVLTELTLTCVCGSCVARLTSHRSLARGQASIRQPTVEAADWVGGVLVGHSFPKQKVTGGQPHSPGNS